jgi:branched-chain amino acid transport system ATP-binding protein
MLRVDNIETFYGASQALFGVTLDIHEGQAVALLGRNGMGKTTTIRTILGSLSPRRGDVTFDGQSLTAKTAFEICRLGFGYVPEGRRIFNNLTVHEHLIAFARRRDQARMWSVQEIYDLFPGLAARRTSPAGLLSGGEQQMLAIGRALVTSPRIIILDEATEGLAPVVREKIWTVLAELKKQKMSILVVDKNVEDVVTLADHAFVLEKGKVAWSGTAAMLASDPKAQQYLSV